MSRFLRTAGLALAAVFFAVSAFASEPIPFRGVVEGYYGRPWGTEGRLSLLKFMGETGLNTFIYGPKDDPYHHGKWREAYPEDQIADFEKLLKCAKANKVNFYWAIHLGGTFKKGSEADYEALFKKLGWMYDAGFRAFAIFFDDFGGSDAEFHAEICNRVQKEFLDTKKGCAPLVMCPNVYWGSGHPYQKTLGAKLDKRVNIMWTGATICHDINRADVEKITADFQRPPFIWWNWPVNDYCRRKLLLGRTYGLDDAKYAGFVSNPMENCEANKLALYGVAAWAKDPAAFDSRKSWEESFAKIYPDPEIAKAMRVFAEHNSDQYQNFHGYHREESVSAKPLCDRALNEYKTNGKIEKKTAAELRALFKEVGGAAKTLLEKLDMEKGLGWEIEGWLETEKLQMAEGMLALDLAGGKKTAVKGIKTAREAIEKVASRHIEKFKAATFPNDRGNVKRPETSTLVLKPLIETILDGELRKLYRAKKGADFQVKGEFKAISGCADFPSLVTSRQGKFAGLAKVMEQKEVKPGEWFGLTVPENWLTNYFHAKLGSPEAVAAGVIEVSKDGEKWEPLKTQNRGSEMHTGLNSAAGWKAARYRNTSAKTVPVKLELFKFDVEGEASLTDDILKAL